MSWISETLFATLTPLIKILSETISKRAIMLAVMNTAGRKLLQSRTNGNLSLSPDFQATNYPFSALKEVSSSRVTSTSPYLLHWERIEKNQKAEAGHSQVR